MPVSQHRDNIEPASRAHFSATGSVPEAYSRLHSSFRCAGRAGLHYQMLWKT